MTIHDAAIASAASVSASVLMMSTHVSPLCAVAMSSSLSVPGVTMGRTCFSVSNDFKAFPDSANLLVTGLGYHLPSPGMSVDHFFWEEFQAIHCRPTNRRMFRYHSFSTPRLPSRPCLITSFLISRMRSFLANSSAFTRSDKVFSLDPGGAEISSSILGMAYSFLIKQMAVGFLSRILPTMLRMQDVCNVPTFISLAIRDSMP